MSTFVPAWPGDKVVIRRTGTGFAFTPFDNMLLCHVAKSSKTGKVQVVTHYKTGKRYTSREWTALCTMPEGVTGAEAHAAFPAEMWLPWQEGVALLRGIRDRKAAKVAA